MNTSVNFMNRRVEAHNTWPISTEFRAEADFKEKIAANAGKAPFVPIVLASNADKDYQTCIGHLIDGLDALPLRPDYFFDHCFRVLDHATTAIAPGKGIEGVMKALPSKLLALDQKSWTAVADLLGRSMPKVTLHLLARRLFQAESATKSHLGGLKKRAPKILGQPFYAQFCKKYLLDASGAPLPKFGANIPKAGSFFKQYLSGKPGTRTASATHPSLDLRGRVIDAEKRMQVLLSLLLFTVRNERAHGSVISPFRTSKATTERYESYYFLALTAYVFALGSLAVRFPNMSVASKKIEDGCKLNLDLHHQFF